MGKYLQIIYLIKTHSEIIELSELNMRTNTQTKKMRQGFEQTLR